jgi:ABC-type dipeptide/oligopeptide/nickel transport system permease component
MDTPDSLALWLREQAWPIAIIAGFFLLTFLVLKFSAKRRQKSLAQQREGVSQESFVTHLQKYGFDPTITGAAYRYLQEVQRVNFPILPADALDEDLGLDTEDINQTVMELTEALGRDRSPGLRHTPIVTVEDLVRLLQASPRKAKMVAA